MPIHNTDVVVVGGGTVGSAAAYFLSKQGKKVTLIEKDSVGTHASGFAYGALSPLGGVGVPGPILPLTIESMRLHRLLAELLREETGIDTQFHLKPTLTLALDQAEAERLKHNFSWQQRQQGYEVSWLNEGEARAIEPRVSPKIIGAVYTQGTAEVDPYRLVLALTQGAEKYGAVSVHGHAVGVKRNGRRVTVVALAKGELLCEEVVLAMGPWTGAASGWLGIEMPIGPLKGQILRLKVPGPPLECTVGWAGNYATTKPDGLVWAGTTEEEVGFDERPTVEARNQIMEALLTMVPAMEDAQLVHHTACLRPVSPDGLLILGAAPGLDNVYIASGAGRKGILLGPLMGRIIADMILRKEIALPIEPFSSERFSPTKA